MRVEYWIVDFEARVVERWQPGDERAELLDESLAWAPGGTVVPLEIDLVELFAEALDR
ncbi:MAG: hypothetical protein O2973_03760 [Gemmatimonadetes bacterium]|nr:hypothetical protein [Gemmatimonadota bacterium]